MLPAKVGWIFSLPRRDTVNGALRRQAISDSTGPHYPSRRCANCCKSEDGTMIERRLLGESAALYPGDGAVSQAAKTTENIRAASPRAADGDVLLFLRRTLPFHSSDAG